MVKYMDIMLFGVAIAVPVIGSFTTLLFRRSLKPLWSILLLSAGFIGSILLLMQISPGYLPSVSVPYTDFFSITFSADHLAVFMALVSTFIGILICVYSIGYMKGYSHQGEYYFYVTLFIGSMIGLVFSANLILMYIFWELTALCSWRLIGFYREEEHLVRADKAFMVTFFGSVLMLVGFAIIYNDYGSLNLSDLAGKNISIIATVLILFGIFAKSAQFPLQVWLPDAGVAPSTVTALLHAAVLVKIGVYAFARIFLKTFVLPPFTVEILGWLIILSILVSAAAALFENDMKRILAYSTISQIGYIMLGFIMGGLYGISGGMFFILAHSLGKAGLFLCAGVIEKNTHIKDIRQSGGLIKTMPLTAMAFLLCAFSVIGIPPFAGFYPKLMVIFSCIQAKQPEIAALAILGAVFTMMYLFRLFNHVFMGKMNNSQLISVKEGSSSMLFVVLLLGIASLIIGLAPNIPLDFIEKMAMP